MLPGQPVEVKEVAAPRLRRDNLKQGAVYMVLAALSFACMGAMVKVASKTLGNEMVVFFRNVTGLLALAPLLWRQGIPELTRSRWHLYVVRSGFGLAAMYCYFYAIAHMRLADAVLLNYTMPLFMPFIALPWLGERLHVRTWMGLAVGFVGVMFILKPGTGLLDPVALVGLLAGLLAAVAQVSIRRLTREDSIVRIVFYFGFFSTLFSAVPLVFMWQTPQPQVWLVLVVMGVFATIGQLLLTGAYAHAPAATVGPFIYAIVVFAGVLDWAFWSALPDRLSIAGAVLICLGGALAIHEQR
jgi:drug/metabolite transporter (DMT)-like permease